MVILIIVIIGLIALFIYFINVNPYFMGEKFMPIMDKLSEFPTIDKQKGTAVLIKELLVYSGTFIFGFVIFICGFAWVLILGLVSAMKNSNDS